MADDSPSESRDDGERHYTPAMLAELLAVPLTAIRRWHRHRQIVPVQEVRRLLYFDFQEVAVAQRLAQLYHAGVSLPEIERKVADLARLLPGVERPILEPAVVMQGQCLLVRQADGLVEAGGQFRFDFEGKQLPPAGDPSAATQPSLAAAAGVLRSVEDVSVSAEQMRALAAEMVKTRAGCLRRPMCIARRWQPPGPTRKAASSLPSCSIARAN